MLLVLDGKGMKRKKVVVVLWEHLFVLKQESLWEFLGIFAAYRETQESWHRGCSMVCLFV